MVNSLSLIKDFAGVGNAEVQIVTYYTVKTV